MEIRSLNSACTPMTPPLSFATTHLRRPYSLFLINLATRSGLKTNKSKTEGLWLGSCKSRLGKDEPFGISWPKRYVTALGIAFPYNVHFGNKINFDERLAINLKMS